MAKTGNEATSLTAAGIEKLHNLIARDLLEEKVFEFPVGIEEIRRFERERWERLREPILFVLRTNEKNERMKPVVDPHTGRRQVVLRLEPAPEVKRSHASLNWWVGWSEEWRPSGQMRPSKQARKQYQFTFEKAAWRLYCTDENDEDTLLVRAEWDRPDEDNPQNSAQPHWHVHHQQKIGIAAAPLMAAQAESGLADMPVLLDEGHPESDEEMQFQAQDESTLIVHPPKWVEIMGIHLGMGGWHNEGVHPKCWQLPFGDLEQTVRDWAVATLKYMRTQLCYIRLPQTGAGSGSGSGGTRLEL